MPRLPQPGGDQGTWGTLLNEFLGEAHNGDGSLKNIPQNKITGLTADLAALAAASAPTTPEQIGAEPTGLSLATKDALAATYETPAAATAKVASEAAARNTAIAAAGATKADLVGGVVPTSQIPAVALTTGQAVTDRAGMLTLTNVQEGDIVAITSTTDKGTYLLGPGSPSQFSSWLPLTSPTDAVVSVNGQNGTVVLGKGDIGLGNVDNTSDANKPIGAATTTALSLKEDKSNRGAVNGYAPLGADQKLPSQYLPALPLVDTYTVASQAAMLALTQADQGDIAIRTDLNKTFVLSNATPNVLANWKELLTPTDTVTSVNGRIGTVTGLAESSELALKAPLASPVFTGGVMLAPGATPSYADGQLYYDNTTNSLNWNNADTNVNLRIGEDQRIRVVNNTVATISAGSPVYITGQVSGLPSIALSRSNAIATSQVIGLTAEPIAVNATGYVVTSGLVRNIDTSAYAAGATVYLSSATAGAMSTSSATSSTNNVVRVGFIGTSSATVGTIHVNPITMPIYSPQGATSDLGLVLSNAGIRSAGTAYPISTSGAVNLAGNIRVGIATPTANVTLSASSVKNQICSAATASFTVTLYTASVGTVHTFKKIDSTTNTVTITVPAAGTIDGSNTYTLYNQYEEVTIIATATAGVWYILERYQVNAMGTVVHGAVAGTARPTGFATITWIGSVAPTNALANDIWMYKA